MASLSDREVGELAASAGRIVSRALATQGSVKVASMSGLESALAKAVKFDSIGQSAGLQRFIEQQARITKLAGSPPAVKRMLEQQARITKLAAPLPGLESTLAKVVKFDSIGQSAGLQRFIEQQARIAEVGSMIDLRSLIPAVEAALPSGLREELAAATDLEWRQRDSRLWARFTAEDYWAYLITAVAVLWFLGWYLNEQVRLGQTFSDSNQASLVLEALGLGTAATGVNRTVRRVYRRIVGEGKVPF